MSTSNVIKNDSLTDMILRILLFVIVLVAGLFMLMLGLVAGKQGLLVPVIDTLRFLFATNTVQAWWYMTRAAGLMAYILLWLSTTWGLAVSSKIFDPWLERLFTFDFHEYLSLLAIGFIALHVIVLMMDQYLPFSIWQILIPFTSSYRPVWVGAGIVSMYLTLLVTITFYLRRYISRQTFRKIHTLSLLAYISTMLHGLFAGTDSALPITNIIYGVTFLSTLFLTVYWLILLWQREEEVHRKELLHTVEKNRRKHVVGSYR